MLIICHLYKFFFNILQLIMRTETFKLFKMYRSWKFNKTIVGEKCDLLPQHKKMLIPKANYENVLLHITFFILCHVWPECNSDSWKIIFLCIRTQFLYLWYTLYMTTEPKKNILNIDTLKIILLISLQYYYLFSYNKKILIIKHINRHF